MIDGLEVKKALEDMYDYSDDQKQRLKVRDGLVAWLSKMRENDRNFSEEVTGDGRPFARIEVVKATINDTRLEQEQPDLTKLESYLGHH